MSEHDRRYEVHDEQLEDALKELARYIDGKLAPGFGCCLMLFSFEPGALSFD